MQLANKDNCHKPPLSTLRTVTIAMKVMHPVPTLRPKGPGRGPKNRNFTKVARRGCKTWFGSREHRSPKSLLYHPNPVLHRCNPLLHQCKRPFAPFAPKTFRTHSFQARKKSTKINILGPETAGWVGGGSKSVLALLDFLGPT